MHASVMQHAVLHEVRRFKIGGSSRESARSFGH